MNNISDYYHPVDMAYYIEKNELLSWYASAKLGDVAITTDNDGNQYICVKTDPGTPEWVLIYPTNKARIMPEEFKEVIINDIKDMTHEEIAQYIWDRFT